MAEHEPELGNLEHAVADLERRFHELESSPMLFQEWSKIWETYEIDKHFEKLPVETVAGIVFVGARAMFPTSIDRSIELLRRWFAHPLITDAMPITRGALSGELATYLVGKGEQSEAAMLINSIATQASLTESLRLGLLRGVILTLDERVDPDLPLVADLQQAINDILRQVGRPCIVFSDDPAERCTLQDVVRILQ